MLSEDRYRRHTGDTSSDAGAIEEMVPDAVRELEEALGRPVEEAERTERMWADQRGRLWPKATPIIEAEGYTIDGLALRGGDTGAVYGQWPIDLGGSGIPDGVDVTYTGGWVAHPDVIGEDGLPANVLPLSIERDLAFAVYRMLHPSAVFVAAPAGAGSIQVGDVAVAGAGGKPLGQANDTSTWWSRRTLGYRYAPIGVRT